MLLACPSCHRQYDVGAYPEGSRVRCQCGNLCTVGKPRTRQVEMLHCSNCGGRLTSGKSACEYCSAEVKLADRGLGPACPECLVTTFAGAKYCQACGVRIAPEAVLRALSTRTCPRCRHALAECESAELRYVSCTGCGGLWLENALFQRIVERKNNDIAALIQGQPPALAAARPRADEVRYLPCPQCGELMNRRNFADSSGIILDWCRGHGWWFDADELERVIAFLQSGGLEHARFLKQERVMQELRNQEDRVRRASAVPFPAGIPRHAHWNLLERLVDLLVDQLR